MTRNLIAPFAPPFVNIPQPGQPYLWMMIGPPGSGKSFWTSCLLSKSRFPRVVISTDHWIDSFAHASGLTYTEAFKRVDFKAIEQAALKEFEQAVARRDHIIIDRTNMTRGARAKWLNRLPRGVYYRTAVIFSPERDVLNERLRKRAEETGKFIPPEVVDDLLAKYQPPLVSEFDAVMRGDVLRGFKV